MSKLLQFVTIALLLQAGGCGVSGHYASEGPCRGFHQDPAACERAVKNAAALSSVSIGQSKAEVRESMGADAERVDATTDTTTWYYLTDYTSEQMTVFTFEKDRLVRISVAPWR